MKPNYSYNSSDEIVSLIHNLFLKSGINVKMISEGGYGKYVLEDFIKEMMPGIIFSDEITQVGDFSTDGLMGVYSLESRSITIYPQGIEKAKQELLKVNTEYYSKNKDSNLYADLTKIVILHELGHYFFHNMDFKHVYWNNEVPQPFASVFIHEMIDEWVAQSFVFNCIKDVNHLFDTFQKLTEIQNVQYKSIFRTDLEKYLPNPIESIWVRIISYLQYFNVKVKPVLDEKQKTQIGYLDIIFDATNMIINYDKYEG